MGQLLKDIFSQPKPIIGMIHLAGSSHKEKVDRGLAELVMYKRAGVNGAIIEDYHGELKDVIETLKQTSRFDQGLAIGLNILQNPYSAFKYAEQYGAQFVQFDSVETDNLQVNAYETLRLAFPQIAVLGGVRFKYVRQTGQNLEEDLRQSIARCEAIVTTGDGTGLETPLDKLKLFRKQLPNFPLFVGAGVTAKNVYEQLAITDGAIVGSYFKVDNNTHNPVNEERLNSLMEVVRKARIDYNI